MTSTSTSQALRLNDAGRSAADASAMGRASVPGTSTAHAMPSAVDVLQEVAEGMRGRLSYHNVMICFMINVMEYLIARESGHEKDILLSVNA